MATQADLRSAHEYVEVLAGQQGASLRSFADTASAIAWLQAVAPPDGKTQSQEKR